jgi:BMFP domain-containing protein YqiC
MSVLTAWLKGGENRAYDVSLRARTFHVVLREDYYTVGDGYADDEEEAMRRALAAEPNQRIRVYRSKLRSRREDVANARGRLKDVEAEIAALEAKLVGHGEEEPHARTRNFDVDGEA